MGNLNEINTEQIKSISILNNNKVKKIKIGDKLWWNCKYPERLTEYFFLDYYPITTNDGEEPIQYNQVITLSMQKKGYANSLFDANEIYLYYNGLRLIDLYNEGASVQIKNRCLLKCQGKGTIKLTNINQSGTTQSIDFILKREDTGEVLTTSIGMYSDYENISPDSGSGDNNKTICERCKQELNDDGTCGCSVDTTITTCPVCGEPLNEYGNCTVGNH